MPKVAFSVPYVAFSCGFVFMIQVFSHNIFNALGLQLGLNGILDARLRFTHTLRIMILISFYRHGLHVR